MSVFVDPNETFPVRVKFAPVRAENGAVMAVRILPPDSQEEGAQEIVCAAAARDFDTMSAALEEASIINHITGEPMVRPSVLDRQIIARFFRAWNLLDNEQQPIPINFETIGKMHHRLVRALARQWLRQTGGRAGG